MKKIFIMFLLFPLLALPVAAKGVKGKTFTCSYITAGTDLHITLKPMTIKNNGDLVTDNEVIGKVIDFGEKSGRIFAIMKTSSSWSIDSKEMLSIYSLQVEDESVFNFGSCIVK